MAELRGGAKLDAYLADTAERVSNPGTLRVGFLEGATYPDGTSVAMVAAIQNFGAPAKGIPPRPFFSNMIAAKSPGWADALGNLLRNNGMDARKALQMAGEGIAGQLRQSIVDTNAPPLAASTVARKGFDTPLVDTGHMLASVDYEVVDAAVQP